MTSIRLAKLNKFNKKLFRIGELKLIWGISGDISKILNRLCKQKILFRVMRGLYSTVEILALNKYELAVAVAGPLSYISTETVLFNQGIIMQSSDVITLVGLKNRIYSFGNVRIKIRALGDKFLNNRLGIFKVDNYDIATKERALTDLYHFNKKYYIDNPKAIDKQLFKQLSLEVYQNEITIE